MIKSKSILSFFVTINKQTEELTLQEGGLLSLKIPKSWQKPDTNTNNPALWVCHLPTNSLGIVFISLYPTELVIKKKEIETSSGNDLEEIDQELKELENSKDKPLIVYRGILEPNGENDQERFYRCRLKRKKEEEPKPEGKSSGWGVLLAFIIIIIVVLAIYTSTSN